MRRRVFFLVDGVLVIAAILLGVRLYETATARPARARPEAPPAVASDAPPPPRPAPARPPLTAYAPIAERNLFSASRTETPPEPPRPAAAAAAAPPAPRPRLHGVVLLPEGRGRAYLEDIQRRRTFAYSVGDRVGDARLEEIKVDRVVLRRGSETFEVLLYDPAKPRQPAAPTGVQSPEQPRPPDTGGGGRPVMRRPPTAPVPPGVGGRAPGRTRAPTAPPVPPPVPSPPSDDSDTSEEE
jgi:hypothetical protein